MKKYYLQKTEGTRLGTKDDLPLLKIGQSVPIQKVLTKDGKWAVVSAAILPNRMEFKDEKAAESRAAKEIGAVVVPCG